MNNNISALIGAILVGIAAFLFGYYKGSKKEDIVIVPPPPIKVECVECDSLQALLDKERQYGDSLTLLLNKPFIDPGNKPGTYKDSSTTVKLDRIIGTR
jgi:hypothetical protein